MKNFNQFVNEGVRDKMTPKSKDDIKKSLDELAPQDRIQTIYKNQVQNLYTDKELKDIFNQLPKDKKFPIILNFGAGNLYTEDELKPYFKDLSPKEKIGQGTEYNLLWVIKDGVEHLPKRSYNWSTVLNRAIFRDIEIVKYLLDNLTIRPDDLNWAITASDKIDKIDKNQKEIKKLLTDKKKEILLGKENFNDILKHACKVGDYNLAKSAINNGANIEHKQGIYLLYDAIDSNSIEIIKMLLDLGVKTDSQNIYPTPIGKAIKDNNNVEVVKLLVEYGARIEFSNWGLLKDIIDWIKKGGKDEMIKYLMTKNDVVKEKIQEHINELQEETKLFQKYL